MSVCSSQGAKLIGIKFLFKPLFCNFLYNLVTGYEDLGQNLAAAALVKGSDQPASESGGGLW